MFSSNLYDFSGYFVSKKQNLFLLIYSKFTDFKFKYLLKMTRYDMTDCFSGFKLLLVTYISACRKDIFLLSLSITGEPR